MSVAKTLTLTLGPVHLQTSNTDSGDRRAAMAYVVPELQRQRYGLGFEILASSDQSSPSCLRPSTAAHWQSKNLFPASSPEFAVIYAEICDTIVSAICELLPNGRWALNVFRMGYEGEKLQNPIVIHLVVYSIGLDTGSGSSSNITEAKASKTVATIKAIVVNSGWKGEE